jgi:hypothetical protein
MVRFLSGCLIFLALAATAPQYSRDLRARYGEPDVERFAVRPDVTMTTEYGPDGKVCELIVEPRQPFLRPSHTPGPTMERETAMDVLHQVVPETRGHEIRRLGGMQDGCGAIEFMAYENISISLGEDACAGRVQSLGVQFNRDACAQWHPGLPHQAVQK